MTDDFTISIGDIPPSARALTALGDKTTKAVDRLFHGGQQTLIPRDIPDLKELSEALRSEWTDEEAATLVSDITHRVTHRIPFDVAKVSRWAMAHPNNAAAVADCMRVNPPPEIDIIRVLSRAGSQKLVFLATWRLTQQEVVLKQLVAEPEDAQRILLRELQPHPLSMVHPNIIETHFLRNSEGEAFLVEQRLPLVLNDDWQSAGMHEAANLLADIGHAVKFLHDNGLVHGDIKPDNIGKKGERYVLLDFGICRPKEQFSRESTPTGSIRTRAPELLEQQGYIEAEKVDVWALGATIFNTMMGRFPLIKAGEKTPRVSSPADRTKFEAELRNRANHWDRWVTLGSIAAPMRDVLAAALDPDPRNRLSSSELIERVQRDLSALLRSSSYSAGYFSPAEELAQLSRHLPQRDLVNLMPAARRQALESRIRELKAIPGFSPQERTQLDHLASRFE
ncbi:MAG TPA: protein kinase [Longimicrobium sp.]|jgi:serine/threonine protein kinase|uniref:protein kinase domain-containing protein n=1 Tax=Longimicrobium sp. TaxID=2029185 RepID=UPI002EDAB6DA